MWPGRIFIQDMGLRPGYNISELAVKRRHVMGGMRNELRDPAREPTETNPRAFGAYGAWESSR